MQVQVREPSSTADSDRGRVLADLLVESGRAAQARDTALVLLVDEGQNASLAVLSDLCHALQHAQTWTEVELGPRGERVRRHLPLAVYVAGLPGLADRIRRAGATFFERAGYLDFGLLDEAETRAALLAAADNCDVAWDAEALDAVVDAISGYPYFLQLIGARTWAAGSGPVITTAEAQAGIDEARTDVQRFYGERLSGLGEVQHDWLLAAARLAPDQRTVGAVAAALGATSERYGWLVTSLTGRGLIRPAPGRGRFEFALPGLDDFVRTAEAD